MRGVDIGDATWIDVDTPAAHAEAERLISVLGEELETQPPEHSRVTRMWPRGGEGRPAAVKKAQER